MDSRIHRITRKKQGKSNENQKIKSRLGIHDMGQYDDFAATKKIPEIVAFV